MQTTTLPIQVTAASAQGPAQRPSGGEGEAGQFSAALSREMEQRRPAPAQQPTKAQSAQKNQSADKPAQANATPAKEESTSTGEDTKAVSQSGDVKETEEAQDGSTPASPVAEMLALVASFNQLQKEAAVSETAATDAALAGTTAKLRGQVDPLATLEISARRQGQTGADADGAALDATAGQRPAFPAALADAARKSATTEQLDMRLPTQAPGQPEFEADMAKSGAQMMREAAAQLDVMKNNAMAPVAQFQPAALETARAVAASDHIPARVGTTGWDNQVGQKIVWMVAGGEQSASLTLNPPDLGPMQVVLNVSGDQASVAFSANQMEVRQALENALPRLREMMGESGIALGNATVSGGGADQRQAQGEQGNRPGLGGNFDNNTAGSDAAPRTATRTTTLGERGMVDLFA